MTPVIFRRGWRMYQPSEQAWFAEEEAARLIASGVAVAVAAAADPAETGAAGSAEAEASKAAAKARAKG